MKSSEIYSQNCGQLLAVVIPCYRVKQHILEVLAGIGPEVDFVYVIDDACPDGSGKYVTANCHDPRIRVITHDVNCGVGGATITGYRQALEDGADIVVKLDGDGQMDPHLVPLLVAPILGGTADYAKGNRFYYLEGVQQMPFVRLVGNAALSFITKVSSGYWDIFDPTNGFTAIHAKAIGRLPLEKIEQRYFFESDLLFRLNTIRAVVIDIPMPGKYGDEKSNLKVSLAIPEFAYKHVCNAVKRIVYNYYLRDFSMVSLELFVAIPLLTCGLFVGVKAWLHSVQSGIAATSGTVMLAALPTLVGIQLLLSFLSADFGNVPKIPLQKRC